MKRNRIRNIRHCFLGAIYLLSNWDFKPRLKKKTAIRRRYSCPSDWRLSTSCGFNWGPLKPLDYHSIIVLLRGLRRPLIGPHYTERRQSFGRNFFRPDLKVCSNLQFHGRYSHSAVGAGGGGVGDISPYIFGQGGWFLPTLQQDEKPLTKFVNHNKIGNDNTRYFLYYFIGNSYLIKRG